MFLIEADRFHKHLFDVERNGKGKGKVSLFFVGSSVSSKAGISGNRRSTLYLPPSVGDPFYRNLKL